MTSVTERGLSSGYSEFIRVRLCDSCDWARDPEPDAKLMYRY